MVSRHIGCLLLAILLAAPAVPIAPAATASPADLTSWSWNVTDGTPSGAFRVTVDFGPDNDCYVKVSATPDGDGPGPRLLLGIGEFGLVVSSVSTVQVHGDVGVYVDTREVSVPDATPSWFGLTSWGVGYDGPIQGVLELNAVATGTTDAGLALMPPLYPVAFGIECEQPFSLLGFSGSHEVFSFNLSSMHGTAASTDLGLATAGIYRDEHVEAAFESDRVEFTLWDRIQEGFSRGNWVLTHEGLRLANRTMDGATQYVSAAAGPGLYEFDLDLVRVARHQAFLGFLAGYEPVTSLDELLRAGHG